MRIAGGTVRRNYLKNYEKNYSDMHKSEQKVSSNRQFLRASENPISAAKALRVRKSMADIATSQKNLQTADSIYQQAESSMMTISSIIQNVYEKLVEGAHGTRNEDDLEILAKEVDNYAEEMVQSLNVDVSDRKIFGGLNNETVAFAIERNATGTGRYVTYNGVAINSSSDPNSFPYSGTSYVDISIGMSVDNTAERIDDQTALPITFNGAECMGCGVTKKTTSLELGFIVPGTTYKLDVYAGGQGETIEFNGGDNDAQTIANINEALKQAFQITPEISPEGKISYLENIEGYTATEVKNYENAAIDDIPTVDLAAMKEGTYYSLEVEANGKTRVIDFEGGSDVNKTLANIRVALDEKFGEEDAPRIYSDGAFLDATGKVCQVKNCADYTNNVAVNQQGDINLEGLTEGESYTVNVNGVKVSFTAGANAEETAANMNEAFASGGAFGDISVPYIDDGGTFRHNNPEITVVVDNSESATTDVELTEHEGYSNNIIQLTLDAAAALREGDQDLVARLADLIYDAQGSLSIAIAELGTNDKFIEYNQTRLEDININLAETQNDLEITDLPSEITNWKVLQSVYNASLQMGSQFLAMSIFDFIK